MKVISYLRARYGHYHFIGVKEAMFESQMASKDLLDITTTHGVDMFKLAKLIEERI